ncbi:outer membrane lipoprotein carrier protein LolA [Halomonas sp. FME1]|uniref:Outer membrane lipoprotein carrier protein LolA n=1 Tax=Halomonas casei TaxID=2742613 RepID=A0ABR9F115_9GAMM|nr:MULTISPECIES: outer membrane lipoprotein carrier protein LolA [Halomonas]MBE0400044.1 outer membrane lipoprotein carrier protein LolA [Halomonas casei]PCC20768.1 hypothetical protein CIK78_00975 [Halomonas sp. JB37]
MMRSINAAFFARALFALTLVTASANAWAAPTIDDLAERLADNAPQCGRFAQTRWLADLNSQLDSRGTFEHQDEGLVWQTTSPINDRVVLSADNEELPMGFQAVAPVLSGLLSGDWQALERYFTIELSDTQDEWQAMLTPSNANIAQRLVHLLVHGHQQVERVEILFTNDDRLEITLSAADCERLDDDDRIP